MQTEVVEQLSYDAVKLLVEYGHNILGESDTEETGSNLPPFL